MRYCAKCGKAYPDDQVFCSQCGENLVIAGNNNDMQNQQQGNYNNSVNTQNNSSGNIFKRHSGLWVGIASMAISWWLNGVVGLILGIFGIRMCKEESSSSLKVVAVICCVIGIILGAIGIIYSFA